MTSSKASLESKNVKIVGKRLKIDRTIGLSAALVLVAVILFGLNYWHSVRCYNAHTSSEIEEIDKSLKHRLLTAESQTLKSSMFLEKVISALQGRLVETEEAELSKLAIRSKDEAAKTQLLLAKRPSPMKHTFFLDDKYKDAEVLADRVTELLKLVDNEKKRGNKSPEDIFGFGESKDDDFFWKEKQDDKWRSADKGRSSSSASISVEEATKICNEWHKKYNVIPNASWGDLPLEEQTRWIKIGCDRYLTVGNTDGAY